MDGACLTAVERLKRIGARNVPSPYIVETAPDGSEWRGRTNVGVSWRLFKHGRERYEYDPGDISVPHTHHGRSAA